MNNEQNFRKFCPIRPERAEAPSPGRMGRNRAYGAKLAKVLFIVHYKLDIIN